MIGRCCYGNIVSNYSYTTALHNRHYNLILTLQYTVLPSVSLSSPVTIDRTPQQGGCVMLLW